MNAPSFTLVVLDQLLLWGHLIFSLFNLLGWAHPRSRRLHLVTILLTAFSWFVLGLFFGIGYCPCTDVHWRVLDAIGEMNLPRSYITYVIRRFFGADPDEDIVDWCVGGAFGIALVMSVVLNYRSRWITRDREPEAG